MIKGKTTSGFAFSVPDNRVKNNAELFDALAELVDGENQNPYAMSQVCTMILGDQKKAFYDHLRGKDGIVPLDKVETELMEIISASSDAKNS